MDMNKFKRDYKFKSNEAYDDGRRNKILIIVSIVVIVLLAYFLR